MLAKGPGCRVRVIHWRIISWLRCGVRRAALLKRSMNALSGSLGSCLIPSRDMVVVGKALQKTMSWDVYRATWVM